MKYKIGDKVRYKCQNPNDNVEVGEVGTICGISKVTGKYGVAFETKDIYKHNCGGLCRDNYGWWCGENTLEPVDSKTLRMADGTIIGDFSTGGFCDGFRGGKISNDLIVSSTEMERAMDRLLKALEKSSVKFGIKKLEQRLKEEKNLKFTFYTEEGYRIDKSNNSKVETITTFVKINGFDNTYLGMATCDKADHSERDGILNAIANAVLGGNFDREYEKFLADKKRKYNESCKCKICGRNYYEDERTGKRTPFTPEDARKHEEWHEQNKKNKRERYLLRKRAKEIAFEEAAQKLAKEMIEK